MLLLSPQNWADYELIDCGAGEKLERFGAYILARPEPKALWDKSLSQKEWNGLAHTRFVQGAGFGKSGKEDSGSWVLVKKMPEQWSVDYQGNGFAEKMRLGLTAFKHIGVFPEQAPNWDYIYGATKRIGDEMGGVPKILNLFAYTGGASLAARAAGADVTHLDAVKQVVTWARENMVLSGMDGIRWMVEDALKFVKRQARRGSLYQGIILDPPAYGHGPEGERWKLDECLFALLRECNAILAPKDSFVLLNLYSNGYSAVLANTLVREAFGGAGHTSFGELIIKDRFGKQLPLSVFVRIER
ncbi:MAG: class I SAM-dependent methyltransferase [Prevotellaceae bacterium]|jgi:23S rRNA (cytosine1962-C5)-methyltransferase|nr:class I SAM-dependent methyltransferase [Prevotellaceae bacterium]